MHCEGKSSVDGHMADSFGFQQSNVAGGYTVIRVGGRHARNYVRKWKGAFKVAVKPG